MVQEEEDMIATSDGQSLQQHGNINNGNDEFNVNIMALL
jgi:hypothetical protein